MESRKELMCRHCGKGFKSRSGLNEHEHVHDGKAPYLCCGKPYFSKSKMQRHRASSHNGPREFTCHYCDKQFATRAEVNQHQVHHEKPKWKCNDCDKEFRLKPALMDHLSSHNDEKKYVCICGKSYIYSQGLSNHKAKCTVVKPS